MGAQHLTTIVQGRAIIIFPSWSSMIFFFYISKNLIPSPSLVIIDHTLIFTYTYNCQERYLIECHPCQSCNKNKTLNLSGMCRPINKISVHFMTFVRTIVLKYLIYSQ